MEPTSRKIAEVERFLSEVAPSYITTTEIKHKFRTTLTGAKNTLSWINQHSNNLRIVEVIGSDNRVWYVEVVL